MIDVIVLSRDRPDYFANCLASLADQGVDFHGVLVDNGTTDHSAGLAHKAGWDVLDFGRNTSFAEGNNLAIAHTEGERVVLINDDAELHTGCLKSLLGHDEAVVGCLSMTRVGTVNFAGGTLVRGMPWHEGRGTAPEMWYCRACDWVTFSCVCLSRDAVEDVGPLDEGYWYSYEDADWCLRARDKGYRPFVCADAVITHDEFGSRSRADDAANRQRFMSKWASQ